MAIIKLSHIVDDISGRIGGQVFARTRSGPSVRKNARLKQPTSKAALDQQALYNRWRHGWQNLSDDARTQWRNAAPGITFQNRLALPRTLTGFQLFMKYGLAQRPEEFPADDLTPPTLQQTLNGTITLDFPAGGPYVLQAARPSLETLPYVHLSGARLFTTSKINYVRYWHKVTIGQAEEAGFTFTTPWNSSLGAPSVDERIAIRFHLTSPGYWPTAPIELIQTVT